MKVEWGLQGLWEGWGMGREELRGSDKGWQINKN